MFDGGFALKAANRDALKNVLELAIKSGYTSKQDGLELTLNPNHSKSGKGPADFLQELESTEGVVWAEPNLIRKLKR